ncbi:MAG: gas vesicle protein [Patescibacteria group bacterium]|mgnify:FL=1
MSNQHIVTSTNATNLADILERVLDKGIVIAGDISIHLADVELLNIRIRLLISSVEKAKEIGISWWETDSYLSPKARKLEFEKENADLKKEIKLLKAGLPVAGRRVKGKGKKRILPR